MKTIFALIVVLWINILFAHSQPNLLDKEVKIEHREGTLGFVLDEIGDKGGFTFSYRQDIPNDKIVTLPNSRQTVRQYLDELFPEGIYCIHFGNKLIIMQRPVLKDAFTLRGKVIDKETKDPIPGVTVYIPESAPLIGSVTDKKGIFELRIPSGVNVVKLSCIGYETRFLQPGKPSEQTIELVPEDQELEEVVIIYYQKPKEENVNGAISSIGAAQLEKMQVGGIENAIQGNASGVHVVRNSGMPGASLQVKIRGINSLINSDPVYYIDGIPIQQTSLYAISPHDIESIKVLKDGASLASYGVTAGNGVVLLNTKKGEQGKTRFLFDFYAGRQEIGKKLELMNKDEFMDFYQIIRPNEDLGETLDSIYSTDWQNVTFHPSGTEEYHFTVSGGKEKSDFYISTGYYRQEAIIKNLQLDRFSFRINSSHRLKPWIQFGQDLSFSYLHYKGLKEGCFMNDFYNPILGTLIIPPYKSKNDSTPTSLSLFYAISNPYSQKAIEHNSRKNYVLNSRLNATVTIAPNLKYVTRIGLETCFQNNISYTSILPHYITLIDCIGITEYMYHIQDLSFDWHHSLQYKATFLNNQRLDATIGFELGQIKCKWTPTQQNTYDETLSYLIDTFEIGQESYEKQHSSTDYIHKGYAASIAYSFKDRLYINSLFRVDEVGFFDTQHDFHKWYAYYPSFSMGWIFTREDFFPVNNVVSYGKLRYGWGKAGNSPRVNYTFFTQIMRDMEYLHSFYYQSIVSTSSLFRRTNEHFYLENIQSHNLGLDLGFLQNKLFFSADYYYVTLNEGKRYGIEKPKEIIEKLNSMYLFGICHPPLSNMQNKGFELELSHRHNGRNIKWNINVNFSHMSNKILDVNENLDMSLLDDDALEPLTINKPGEVAGSFYGYKTQGLFRAEDCNEKGMATNQPYTINAYGNKIYAQPSAIEGDYRFTDINNDSVIDINDRIILGNPLPDFTFGLFCQMEWKNFDLSVLIQGTYGNEIFNATKLYLYNPYAQSNWSKDLAKSYRPATYNDDGELVDPGYTNTNLPQFKYYSNRNLRVSDFYVEDGSYLRLKNLQLGYTFQPNLTKRVHIHQFRIFLSLQNLLTFTRYSGLDPEVGGWGIDCGAYPQPRTYLVGANVEF